MNLLDLIRLTNCSIITRAADLNREIAGGCGSDLMSDVLACASPGSVLLTGLCHPQVVRTAQMADLAAIWFVRGKQPPEETIRLAEQEEIPLLCSPDGMFELCGRLYAAGLPGLERVFELDGRHAG